MASESRHAPVSEGAYLSRLLAAPAEFMLPPRGRLFFPEGGIFVLGCRLEKSVGCCSYDTVG